MTATHTRATCNGMPAKYNRTDDEKRNIQTQIMQATNAIESCMTEQFMTRATRYRIVVDTSTATTAATATGRTYMACIYRERQSYA